MHRNHGENVFKLKIFVSLDRGETNHKMTVFMTILLRGQSKERNKGLWFDSQFTVNKTIERLDGQQDNN